MTAHPAQTLLDALRLPQQARLEQRIPKKLLLENSTATAADKRLLNDAIEEIRWIAALKPHTIGIPAYHDAIREYLEIAVLAVTLRSDLTPARQTRLAALIHRAIPYPLFLLYWQDKHPPCRWRTNAAHKTKQTKPYSMASHYP